MPIEGRDCEGHSPALRLFDGDTRWAARLESAPLEKPPAIKIGGPKCGPCAGGAYIGLYVCADSRCCDLDTGEAFGRAKARRHEGSAAATVGVLS